VCDLAQFGVTHLVACDGGYDLFPGGLGRSRTAQGDMLRKATHRCGMTLVLVEPATPWRGNEVEKRQAMLNYALAHSREGDWLVAYDADFVLEEINVNVVEELWACGEDGFIDVSFTDSPAPDETSWYPLRIFLPAIQGMTLPSNHYTYRLPDGRHYSVGDRTSSSPLTFKDKIKIRHRTDLRRPGRREKQITYYEKRDKAGIEK
jgi:hypothetical protein